MRTEAGGARAPCRTALVLGGSGFLGRHIVQALRDDDVDVLAAGRRTAQPSQSIRLDLLRDSLDAVSAAIAELRPDVVVNCAGCTNGSVRMLVDGNAVVPARLLAAVATASPNARVIHLGSAGEYGATAADHRVDECTLEAPVSAYGVSKLTGTTLMMRAADDNGIDALVLRVFNPIGAGSPASSLPGRTAGMIRAALRYEPHDDIDIGPLDSYRDWVDARDVATAVVAAARACAPSSRLYNVGSGTAVRSREVVELIAEVAGYRGTVREEDAVPVRSGAVSWQQADISRAAEELHWRPQYTLSDSVKALWRCAQ